MQTKVRVWDLPTRIFHWTLVLTLVGSVTTAQVGGEAMDWHFRCGYAVLSLLLFRLVWGLIGGRWSRFASFMDAPSTIFRYLRGQGHPKQIVGHSPLGALSVFTLLLFLMAQVASGLVSDDEITLVGPLAKYVSNEVIRNATFYHASIGKLILIGLTLLHIGAILFYLFRKKENLIRPMIFGDKEITIEAESARDDATTRLLAAAVLLACAMLVALVIKLAV